MGSRAKGEQTLLVNSPDQGAASAPAYNTAYILASSRDPLKFIKRRGRILRKSPGKTIATIHDFIVILPPSTYDESGHARNLMESELRRVAEFSALALNRTEAYERLRDVLTAYDIDHVI